MFRHLRKYRVSIATATMLSFVAAGFQLPLLEGLHIVSHLTASISAGHESHGYHSHTGSHSHALLDLVAAVGQKTNGDLPGPVNDNQDSEFKKLPKCFFAIPCFLAPPALESGEIAYFQHPIAVSFRSVPFQPPNVVFA